MILRIISPKNYFFKTMSSVSLDVEILDETSERVDDIQDLKQGPIQRAAARRV